MRAVSKEGFHYDSRNCYVLDLNNSVTHLNLSRNNLTNIKDLYRFINLQDLYLWNNQLTEIEGLENLKNLQDLNISYNKFTEIKGLENLKNLRKLHLSNNLLTKIKGLENLDNLKYLSLYNNQLTKIEGLGNLVMLQELHLWGNQLTKIEGIKSLINLKELYLSNNRLESIVGIEDLINLHTLYLSSNQLTEISVLEKIINRKGFKRLQIANNPFLRKDSLKLESNKNHKDDLLKYFSDLKQKKVNISLPSKILFLGNHGSGKTTFLKYLQDGKLPSDSPESTHLLQIHSYIEQEEENKLPEAMIYDFGGQDYYHGLYRAFFSEEAINLLFWCVKLNKNEIRKTHDTTNSNTCDFTWEYWLYQLNEIIKRRIQNASEPLLIIQTHADIKEDKKFFYSNDILDNFEIGGTYYISLKQVDKRLERLREDLLEIIKGRRKIEKRLNYYEDFLSYVLSWDSEESIKITDILNKGHYKRSKIRQETDEDLLIYLKSDLNQLYLRGIVL